MVWIVRVGGIFVLGWATIVFLSLPDPADRTGAVIVGVAGLVALAMVILPPLSKLLDPIESAIARAGERRRLINMGYSTGSNERKPITVTSSPN